MVGMEDMTMTKTGTPVPLSVSQALCVTSAVSERAFSSADWVVTADQSSLYHINVKKLLIHDAYRYRVAQNFLRNSYGCHFWAKNYRLKYRLCLRSTWGRVQVSSSPLDWGDSLMREISPFQQIFVKPPPTNIRLRSASRRRRHKFCLKPPPQKFGRLRALNPINYVYFILIVYWLWQLLFIFITQRERGKRSCCQIPLHHTPTQVGLNAQRTQD